MNRKLEYSRLASLSLAFIGVGAAYAADLIRPVPILPIGPREISCTEALKPYFDWASGATPAPEEFREVVVMSVFNQQKNSNQPGLDRNSNVVGYSVGFLKFHQGGMLVGNVTSYFNDRTYCAEQPPGGFCNLTAPFNPKAADLSEFTVSPDGNLKTVLKSWGNATYNDTMVCMSNGIIYIPTKAGQKHMSVITLQKTGYRRPH